MFFVLLLAGVIWGIGAALRVPVKDRWPMLGLLYVAVLAVQIALPDGHPLREATGREPGLWLLIGGLAAVVLVYRLALKRLRGKAEVKEAAEAPVAPREQFSEAQLDRYARHIVLREIGGTGQKRLRDARVLVVGAGGLGSPALLYLAGAGVGTIGVIDDDLVDNSNLQRQVLHRDEDIGVPKVFSAKAAMERLNPWVTVRPYHRKLTADIAPDLFNDYDLVLDGTDDSETRYLVNATCVKLGLPLISGALSQWEGQVSAFDPARNAPCYACVFPNAAAAGLAPSCAEAGVVGPLPGVIGSMMAVEAVKLLTGAGQPLFGQMLTYDALWGETRTIRVSRDPKCAVCGSSVAASAEPSILTAKTEQGA